MWDNEDRSVGELCPLGRSDIFSLGAVLYEMVTGLQALEGKSQHSIASAILEKEPAAISITKPLAPRSLDHIIPPLSVKRPPKIQATLSEFSMAELSAFRLLWSSPER